MTEFENKQAILEASRNEMETARLNLYEQEELLKLQQLKIKHRLAQERIPFLSDQDSDQKILVKLQDKVYNHQVGYEETQVTNETSEEDFNAIDEHIKMVENLDDSFPILMMPVQVQTRFINVKHLATNVPQESIFDVDFSKLPDAINSIQFQESYLEKNLFNIPTYSTLRNEHALLHNYHYHYGFQQFEKSNFKDRKWLKAVPDSKELWVRIYPDDIFVNAHEPHLTPEERIDGEAFWKKWWTIHSENENALEDEHQADDLLEKPLFTAWSFLHRKYHHTRAAWIFRTTMPKNYSPTASIDYKNSTPDFSTKNIIVKSEDWTEPILSWVMPDKFVVTLKQGDFTQHFEGNKIPFPLKLSPSPKEDASLDEIKWVEDFEAAEKIGMAIRISLTENDFSTNIPFEKLIVAGIKTSVKAKNDGGLGGKEMLESLLENHRYKGEGMAFLPQGTATNNFEKVRSGFTAEGLPEQEVFKLETGQPLFEDETNWKTKKDGKYLVNALGVDASIFQHIHKSGSKDIAHSFAMNKLLWSATMGYHLKQFFQPMISLADIEKTKDFFFDHVSARGLLPVFRVNQQPYGILPITNFSNWKFKDGEDPFFINFYEKILKPLDSVWQGLSQNIKNISDPTLNLEQGQFSEEFLRILGLSASSTTFFQRPVIGSHVIENSVAANFATKPKKGTGYLSSLIPGPDNPTQYVDYSMRSRASYEYMNGSITKQLKDLNFGLPYEGSYLNNLMFVHEKIFKMHFARIYRELPNQFIENLKPSEQRKLSNLKNKNLNYLKWLKDASHSDLMENFPKEIKDEDKPTALLYLLARQAMARNYVEVAAKLIPNYTVINGRQHAQYKDISSIDFELEHLFDKSFFEIYQGETVQKFGGEVEHFLRKLGKNSNQVHPYDYLYNNNKWNYLQQKKEESTNETIGEFLDNLKLSNTTKNYLPLTDAKRALDCLKDESTAGLERLFSEHLDLCSHRLDAWMLGLVNRRLDSLRSKEKSGIYLGAFGYVENLAPKNVNEKSIYKIIDAPELEEAKSKTKFKQGGLVLPFVDLKSFKEKGIDVNELLQNSFIYLGKQSSGIFERSKNDPNEIISQPYFDAANEGYIHTPSPAHATTAAILRSGYMSNNPEKDYDEFAINLSSARVRKALYYIKGMRNGQELAALLGYQFERELHDNPIPDLDKYIFEFRMLFPFGKKNEPTNEPIESQKPFNVVHGIDLINAYRKAKKEKKNFFENKNLIASISNQNQIEQAIQHLSESMDAISDLLLSESIYHTAKGDATRSGSVLKMLSNDKEIEIPEIIKTPKSGQPLSHIIGVQFNLKGPEHVWAKAGTPRSFLNPGLNYWLSEQLPNPRTMCFNIQIGDEIKKLSVRNVIYQPIDFLALMKMKNPFSETGALTYFIKTVAIKFFKPSLDTPIQVLYPDRTGFGKTQKTLIELKQLFDTLNKIIADSRPMLPTDLQLSSTTRPLEAAFYENLDNSMFIDEFEKIVNNNESNTFVYMHSWIKGHSNKLKKEKKDGIPKEDKQTTYGVVIRLLNEQFLFTELLEDYTFPFEYSNDAADEIIEKGIRAHQKFAPIAKRVKSFFKEIKKMTGKKEQWESLVELGKMLFGNTLTLSPQFRLNNPDEFKAAKEFPDLMIDLDEDAPAEWLQGVSLVREKTRQYKKLETYRDLFKAKSKNEKLEILQLPFQANSENYRWLGSDFSPQIKIKGEQLSIALEFPTSYKTTNLQSGMIIDFWTERIQSETTETAFAVHYNQPNAEPPQSCLLCVTPNITGNWNWEDIVGCVESAMDMAKKRAVEPEQLAIDLADGADGKYNMKGHPLRYMLPALSIPVSNTKNTPALGFDENNNHF